MPTARRWITAPRASLALMNCRLLLQHNHSILPQNSFPGIEAILQANKTASPPVSPGITRNEDFYRVEASDAAAPPPATSKTSGETNEDYDEVLPFTARCSAWVSACTTTTNRQHVAAAMPTLLLDPPPHSENRPIKTTIAFSRKIYSLVLKLFYKPIRPPPHLPPPVLLATKISIESRPLMLLHPPCHLEDFGRDE